MHRFGSGLVVLALLLAMPAAVAAAKPDGSCPAAASGFDRVDRDEWWDRSVAGWEEAGITVYDASGNYTAEFEAWARELGFPDAAAVEDFVRGAQWDIIDKNRNDFVCMRNQPNTPGQPGYIFVGIDDTASAS